MKNIINNNAIRKFLAIDRITALINSFNQETNKERPPLLSYPIILLALIISLIPVLGIISNNAKTSGVNTSLLLTGVATILAILVRIKVNIKLISVENWKRDLNITHTAFALSCIPIVILLIISPDSLNSIIENKNSTATSTGHSFSINDLVIFILQVSLWAGLTEEFIYRGMLISVIRRWKIKISQNKKDILAIVISSLIFGLSHIPSWGIAMSLAVVSLGIGFGVAYIAIGERILPLIVYHIVFDILSLLASVFLR